MCMHQRFIGEGVEREMHMSSIAVVTVFVDDKGEMDGNGPSQLSRSSVAVLTRTHLRDLAIALRALDCARKISRKDLAVACAQMQHRLSRNQPFPRHLWVSESA